MTVTYGRRLTLLTRVLGAARAQGAAWAVVIDNGSLDPVAEVIGSRFGGWARVHNLGGNLGSAVGFKAGIARALADGAEFILLLDDDNLLSASCLAVMSERWMSFKTAGEAPDHFAVHATRLALNESGAAARLQIPEPRDSSFLGFHVAEMPYKILRRMAPGLLGGRANDAGATSVSVAPYGGMLFHRDVIARIGLPDEKFFLYGDDYEFCTRLTAGGGRIHLVRDAVIHEIDTTWGAVEESHRSALFTARLEIRDLSKLYYSIRNLSYFERHLYPRKIALYLLNWLIYMTILTILAIATRKLPQYRTILEGVKDGRQSRLGMNQAYPL